MLCLITYYKIITVITLFYLVSTSTIYGDHHCGGNIIAAHDVNILSTSLAGPEEVQFILNTLQYLVGPVPGNILAVESASPDILRDYSPVIRNALTTAGYTVTYTRDSSLTLVDLQNYDAVLVGVLYPEESMIDPGVLTDYVNSGGNIYIYGGVAMDINENSILNNFLTNFGLEYTNVYNLLAGDLTVVSNHPIFNNVSSLEAGNGLNLSVLGSSPFSSIIGYSSGQAIFAAYSPSCPTPIPTTSVIGLLLTVIITMGIVFSKKYILR